MIQLNWLEISDICARDRHRQFLVLNGELTNGELWIFEMLKMKRQTPKCPQSRKCSDPPPLADPLLMPRGSGTGAEMNRPLWAPPCATRWCPALWTLLLSPPLPWCTLLCQSCRELDLASQTDASDTVYGLDNMLLNDYDIDCGSPAYHAAYVCSWTCLGLYGVLVPLALPLIGRTLRQARPRLEREAFAFLILCFKPRFRYWESVIMARKFALVLVMALVPSPQRQAVACTAVLVAFLVLHIACRPCDTRVANGLEGLTLLSLALVLGVLVLSDLFALPDQPQGLPAGLQVLLEGFCAVSVPANSGKRSTALYHSELMTNACKPCQP